MRHRKATQVYVEEEEEDYSNMAVLAPGPVPSALHCGRSEWWW